MSPAVWGNSPIGVVNQINLTISTVCLFSRAIYKLLWKKNDNINKNLTQGVKLAQADNVQLHPHNFHSLFNDELGEY